MESGQPELVNADKKKEKKTPQKRTKKNCKQAESEAAATGAKEISTDVYAEAHLSQVDVST